MIFSAPSEHELHAYVDDRLDPARRAQITLWLASHPQEQAMVDGWRDDARRLRAALAGGYDARADAGPSLATVRQRLVRRRRQHLATAALLLLTLGLGSLGGWQAREATWLAGTPPMADAVQAHRLFAETAALDIQARDPARLRAWLARHFTQVGDLPDLAEQGLVPVGARLLANENGPAALLLYEDAQGGRLSVFLRAPGRHFGHMASGQRREGALEARYWSHGAYNFAVVGPAQDTQGERLEQALRTAL
ncbi:anti-sigma factor [Pseudomonas entomophila]|uniref:anti-sigma factor family protein n=1 Tax=Pseudomonas entomophila TaxID=312306 RepID=UPI0015E356D0|nr:anti-sigma factor [Pseudomonas entomophila]MBA1190439.1 anti-sigma factor [Pseudomonas entomophila]